MKDGSWKPVEETRDAAPDLPDLLGNPAFFKGILDIAQDAVISIDSAQRIVLFNQGAERIFGYTAAEVLGQPLDLLLPPQARAGHHAEVEGFQAGHNPSRPMNERGGIAGRRKDGTVFPAEASISKLVVDGRMVFTAMLRDVTKAREAENAIRALNAQLGERALQLENANRELEAFSYSVSHDLRAPLRSIDGFSQLLLEDHAVALDAEGRNYLERVRTASQRMAQLIDDILNLSRVTRGTVAREPVDLSAIARKTAAELIRQEPERTVTWQIVDGVEAEADPRLMQVVIGNLLGNAWKYTSRHPTATIAFGVTTAEDEERVFYVSDDGAGFDMLYVNKLFGAFQRLHGMKDFPGNGVGLATVQRIIHKHGGRVWAEGKVEHGATFYFTLNEDRD